MIGVITNLPGQPHKLASSMGDALAGYEQAPRVTNTIHKLKHEPSIWQLKISWVSSLMQFGGSNSQGFARESKGEA
jgi:hypothetical protein